MNLQKIIERETGFVNEQGLIDVKRARIILAMYRFLTFDSQLFTDLHGASVITKKGNAILFGDGIDCIGKTTSSLVIAHDSGKYLVDECTLYNQATGSVYGNKEMPIHIRPCYAEYFENLFGTKFGKMDGDFGKFVSAEELGLEIIEKARLMAIICPRPNKDRIEITEEKDPVIKAHKLAIVANAHHLKFVDNSLDRVNGKDDKGGEKIELSDLMSGYTIPKQILDLPYYDMYVTKPDDVRTLIERTNL